MLEVILLATQLAGGSIYFDRAKSLADANEINISSNLRSQLLKAQGKALGSAVATCRHANMDLTAFTIVLSLNADGSVKKSWRNGDTPLAQCIHGELMRFGLSGKWPTPFYTSIELSFDELA